jgi:CheY-like chemotaxis protein
MIPGDAVLLVQDDAELGEILAMMLEYLCADVAWATSAEQALTLAAARPFTVMFTDVHLPGIDGYELAAAIRALHPGIRVYGMSGGAEDRNRGAAAGMLDYLPKPVTLEQLRHALGG